MRKVAIASMLLAAAAIAQPYNLKQPNIRELVRPRQYRTDGNEATSRLGQSSFYECPTTTPGTNLISAPEALDNVAWTKYNFGGPALPTITADATTAPDGTLTADRMQTPLVGVGFQSAILQSVGSTSGTFAVSYYIKGNGTSGSYNWAALYSNAVCNAGSYNSGGWTRVSFTGTITATGQIRIGADEAVCGGGPIAAQDVFLWGIKVESGSTVTPYKAVSCP